MNHLPAAALVAIVLAAVLATSALAKWRDRPATISAIRLLRLPGWLQAPWVSTALPIGEVVLAAGLLAPWHPIALASTVATALLLLVYLVVIARAMTFTPRPSCGCFGRIGDQRVTARTVVRNAILLAGSLVVLGSSLQGGTVPTALAGAPWAWVAAGLYAVVVTALIVGPGTSGGAASPLPSHHESQSVPDSLGGPTAGELELDYIRTPVPHSLLIDPEGRPRLLSELTLRKAQLLVFVTCACGSTIATIPRIAAWQELLPELDVRIVTNASKPDIGLPVSWWLDHGAVTYTALGMVGSPAAVLLGTDGQLAGGPVSGLADIEVFVTDIVAELEPMRLAAPIAGELAPAGDSTDLRAGL